tara:strand:- start:2603 stop:3352 length:750 start_codon:yes stop_codon:yes gene_type:complete
MERIYFGFFSLFLLLQILFWYHTQDIKPKLDILPKLQSKKSIVGLSFGDKEFYFRNLSIKLQNSGDQFGNYTSLKKYDYELLYNWLITLSDLNYKSKFTPAIATFFYSAVPDKSKIYWMVKFLEEYAEKDIDKNWWWMFQAVTLSKMFIKDDKIALKLAYKLSKTQNPDAPYFTRQMPAIIHSRMGDYCQSFLIMKDLRDKYNKIGDDITSSAIDDIHFMNIFVKKQMNKLQEANFDPSKCKITNKDIK